MLDNEVPVDLHLILSPDESPASFCVDVAKQFQRIQIHEYIARHSIEDI